MSKINGNLQGHNQSPQIDSQVIHFKDQLSQHHHHIPGHRCSHLHKESQREVTLKNKFIDDNPHVLLPDQHIRDLTNVYRREKNFLEEKPSSRTQENQTIINTNEEYEPNYDTEGHYYAIPCTCQKSLAERIIQNLADGLKLGIDFFLFMSDVIQHRNELFEYNYPFIHRTNYNNQRMELNTIRNQLNRRSSPIKYTTTNTYYDIH